MINVLKELIVQMLMIFFVTIVHQMLNVQEEILFFQIKDIGKALIIHQISFFVILINIIAVEVILIKKTLVHLDMLVLFALNVISREPIIMELLFLKQVKVVITVLYHLH